MHFLMFWTIPQSKQIVSHTKRHFLIRINTVSSTWNKRLPGPLNILCLKYCVSNSNSNLSHSNSFQFYGIIGGVKKLQIILSKFSNLGNHNWLIKHTNIIIAQILPKAKKITDFRKKYNILTQDIFPLRIRSTTL